MNQNRMPKYRYNDSKVKSRKVQQSSDKSVTDDALKVLERKIDAEAAHIGLVIADIFTFLTKSAVMLPDMEFHTKLLNLTVDDCGISLDEVRELIKMGCFDMIEVLYGNTPDILSQLIRTMLIPKEGCEFIVADFSAIEARVLAWLAGKQWRLDAFERGENIYCASASQMFGVPVVKHGINGKLRQKGKVAELACGYGGGAGALISMCALDMGLKDDELPEIISSWRDANPNIVKFWYAVEKSAIGTIKDHQDRTVGHIGCQFSANTLWIVLPSGRKLKDSHIS